MEAESKKMRSGQQLKDYNPTEFANENDSRLAMYNQKPDRLPCLMLFKNDTHKTHINAKLSNEKAIEWTKSRVG